MHVQYSVSFRSVFSQNWLLKWGLTFIGGVFKRNQTQNLVPFGVNVCFCSLIVSRLFGFSNCNDHRQIMRKPAQRGTVLDPQPFIKRTPKLKETQKMFFVVILCFFLVIFLTACCLFQFLFGCFFVSFEFVLHFFVVTLCLLTNLYDFQTRNTNTHLISLTIHGTYIWCMWEFCFIFC